VFIVFQAALGSIYLSHTYTLTHTLSLHFLVTNIVADDEITLALEISRTHALVTRRLEDWRKIQEKKQQSQAQDTKSTNNFFFFEK
jgi:hypothetical protein